MRIREDHLQDCLALTHNLMQDQQRRPLGMEHQLHLSILLHLVVSLLLLHPHLLIMLNLPTIMLIATIVMITMSLLQLIMALPNLFLTATFRQPLHLLLLLHLQPITEYQRLNLFQLTMVCQRPNLFQLTTVCLRLNLFPIATFQQLLHLRQITEYQRPNLFQLTMVCQRPNLFPLTTVSQKLIRSQPTMVFHKQSLCPQIMVRPQIMGHPQIMEHLLKHPYQIMETQMIIPMIHMTIMVHLIHNIMK